MTTTNPAVQHQPRTATTALMLGLVGLSLIVGSKTVSSDPVDGPAAHRHSPAANASPSRSAFVPGSMGGYAPDNPQLQLVGRRHTTNRR